MKTLVTLVPASSSSECERRIAAAIGHELAQAMPACADTSARAAQYAVLLEGLPDGQGLLEDLLAPSRLIRIAPGCLCCIGNTVMRVSLNRLLRHKPVRLFIALTDSAHQERLRAILQQAPYDQWLEIGADL